MYKVGDQVIVTKYTIAYLGEIVYVKGYDRAKRFYIVRFENGTEDHFAEEDLIKGD